MAHCSLRSAYFLLLLATESVEGQIRVLAPKWLKSGLGGKGSKGLIQGSTATFGAPFYGDDVVGRLVYGESKGLSHCRGDDYDLSDVRPAAVDSGENGDRKMIDIVIVKRGHCSFTTKVQVAMDKGAHAVIIVDRDDSDLTEKTLQKVIVGDDGYGSNIHIPSVLISKEQGKKLIEAVKKSEVVVELSWNVPADHIVRVDLWMSSGSLESLEFLKKFSSRRKTLNEVMSFTPHYSVFSMPSSDPSVYQGLCSDVSGKFCAEDPDGSGDVTGKDVLDEDVRQLCIHELTKPDGSKKRDAAESENKMAKQLNKVFKGNFAAPTMAGVWFDEAFWNYIEKLAERCPVSGTAEDAKFGFTCSEKLMSEVGIDTKSVGKCFRDTYESKLQNERDHQAWSPKALRINGWHYKGMLDADLVTRAICAGFHNKPGECNDMIDERDPFAKYGGANEGSVGFSTFIFGLVGVALISCCVLFFYKKSLQDQVQSSVREEVMLEVQNAMTQYNRLHNTD